AAGSCSDPQGPLLESGPNYLRVQSDAGDPVGGGQSYDYTAANALIAVDHRFAGIAALNLAITAADRWSIYLYPPDRYSELVAGSNENARSFPADPTQPRISVARQSTVGTCAQATGRFTIVRVEYVPNSKVDYPPSGVLAAIDATFEQRCTGASGSLRGTIHWRAE
ncbi:MAG TPA: hypothetical protein VKA54_10865, partial [Gemmatimonadaceae bacterium]|nr:hypothetical protein [Gemmatimonadaceae bacterium]